MVSEDLGFGQKPPTPVSALDPRCLVAEAVQPSTRFDGNLQQAVLPLPDISDAYDTTYLRFQMSDKILASSIEAKLLWPMLRLPSMKPQGSACHMSRLGQGEFSTQFAYQVASFLWFQRDPAGVLVTHRSLSIDWAGSCKIIWIMSTGVYQRQQHTLVDSADEYSNSGGLWIETSKNTFKDTFKLLNGSAMSRNAHHQVEVAFQKGGSGWYPDMRWFVGVWVDGVLCRTQLWSSLQNARSGFFRWFYPPRLHPGELKDNLRRGGRDASFVVEWIGGGGEVTDLRAHSGELVRCSNPQHQLVHPVEASARSQVESHCKWERYQCPCTGSIWWWSSGTGQHFYESTGLPTEEQGSKQVLWQRFKSPRHGGAVWWWNSLTNDFFFAETGSPTPPKWRS